MLTCLVVDGLSHPYNHHRIPSPTCNTCGLLWLLDLIDLGEELFEEVVHDGLVRDGGHHAVDAGRALLGQLLVALGEYMIY